MSALDFPYIDDDSSHELPVVFLHAFPYHSAMWEPQRVALRGQARFIAFDTRGVGMRRQDTAAYMLEHSVDDLLALLDRLSIERAVLCGVSMGGYIALRAVQRAPERVRGLFLADTQAASDSDEAKHARAEGLRLLHREGVEAFVKKQVDKQLSAASKERPALVGGLVSMAAGASASGIAANLVAIATRTDQTTTLADIAVPTRIVVGAEDTITPPAAARKMADAIAGADLHVLEKTGHLSSLEAESAFNSLLLEYLAKLR